MFAYLKNQTENLTNKKVSNRVLPHIKVAAQNSIQFSPNCLEAIGHEKGNYIYVGSVPGGQILIASIPAEAAEEQGLGRALNKNENGSPIEKMTNASIAKSLGGYKSEWKVETSEPVHHDDNGSVWAITQTVNGADLVEEKSTEEVEEVTEEVASSPVYESEENNEEETVTFQ